MFTTNWDPNSHSPCTPTAKLPLALFDALQIGCMVGGALLLVAIAVPVVLPVFVPLLIAFFLLRRR